MARLGVIAYVVAYGVPLMLTLHVLIFVTLLRRDGPRSAT